MPYCPQKSPIYPEKREQTNFFWLFVFLCVTIFTISLICVCYDKSNWYNIKDIQDYDGSGLIYVTQNAVIYWENIAVAAGTAVLICFLMIILLMWLSSVFMVLSLGVVSLYLIVLVALAWERFDEKRTTTFLVFGIILSLAMPIWFIFFWRIGKKIELIFHLFHIAGAIMKDNLRMLLYTPLVSQSKSAFVIPSK